MTTITLDKIQEALEKILAEPFSAPESTHVRDQRTDSIGLVEDRLGPWLNEHGKVVDIIYVKVVKPKAHHKKGDFVFWRDPEAIG